MPIITNGRSVYEMDSINVIYPDIGQVSYTGSCPLIVSNQWCPLKKGDLIWLDNKLYRILKITGSVAEVLAMYDAATRQHFGDIDSTNTYANSDLDTYLSGTFYNSLPIKIKNAIVAKSFQQDSWYYGSNPKAIAKYNGTYQTAAQETKNYILSLMSPSYGKSISRNCYVISCQDVIDYLNVTSSMPPADTTLTSENIWKLFWNQSTSSGDTLLWLRSARPGDDYDRVFVSSGVDGGLGTNIVGGTGAVRPAFQIDLLKVEWSKA